MSLTVEERRKKYNIPTVPIIPLTLNVIYTPKVYGYIRVSTNKQEKEGASLEAQELMIKRYCTDRNLLEPIPMHEGGKSGKNMRDRPKFMEMCQLLHDGDTIVTYSLSRLGRNTEEILHFMRNMKDRNIKVVCLKENIEPNTITGELLMSILASINQFEMNQTRERTADTLRALKAAGKLRTKPHFGWGYVGVGKDRTLVEKPQEQEVINFILTHITLNPEIRDTTLAKFINIEIKEGRLSFRHPTIYSYQVHRIITHNSLRNG